MPDENMRALAVVDRDVFGRPLPSRRAFNHQSQEGVATATPEFNINKHQPQRA
jgi:hypothetical protein